MAAVTKHYCDWKDCKAERATDEAIQVFSHSRMDASGNGRDNFHASFDLCSQHLVLFTLALIENMERVGRFGAVKPRSPFEIVKSLQIRFELT
jgi:hypothetical protein